MKNFDPCGKTILFTAEDDTSTAVNIPSSPAGTQYRIFNSGENIIYYAFGTSKSEAESFIGIPTGTGSNSKRTVPLPSGAIEIVTAPSNAYFIAIVDLGNPACNVYITPGLAK